MFDEIIPADGMPFLVSFTHGGDKRHLYDFPIWGLSKIIPTFAEAMLNLNSAITPSTDPSFEKIHRGYYKEVQKILDLLNTKYNKQVLFADVHLVETISEEVLVFSASPESKLIHHISNSLESSSVSHAFQKSPFGDNLIQAFSKNPIVANAFQIAIRANLMKVKEDGWSQPSRAHRIIEELFPVASIADEL